MADFFVWATFDSVWSSFSGNGSFARQPFGGPRDATISDGDGTLTLSESTAFRFTGDGGDVGPYEMYSFTMSNGGTAIWMAGAGNLGGLLVPTNEIAYDTLTAGTQFTITGSSTISSVAYSSFFAPIPNTAPTVTGVPSDVIVTEDVLSNVDLSAVTFADAEDDMLTVHLVASSGTLTSTSGGSVIISGSGGGTLTLTGTAGNINVFLDNASNVRYTSASNANGNDAANIRIFASDPDGAFLSSTPQINLDITSVNDVPTVTAAPASITVAEDMLSNVDLSAMSFADLDGDTLTVALVASEGTFTSFTGGGVTVSGSGTGTLTLTGAAANINNFLDFATNIRYQGALNDSGTSAATITVSASDGMGGNLVSDPVVLVNITAENDVPTVSGAPSDVTVVEDTASNVDLSAMAFADVDGDTLTVTLAASAGTLAATTGGGVTVGGTGTGTLTLAGTAAAINTFLDTASNVQYTGVANANGNDAATLTVSTIDGQGGSLASNPVINLDITAQNDAPTVTGTPADIAVSEDQAGNVDLSALTFADVDAGDTLTVTLTAGSGILAANSAGGVVVGDSGTSAISLAGTAAAITVFLQTASNIQYTSALNANGDDADTITVSALDGGGAVLASNPVINVDIAAVNDIPTVTGAPADLTVLEDTASNLDLSGMSFADVDGDPLTVTLSVNAGMLAATTGGGVTVGGTGTGTLTLAGTAAAINTFLDTASNVQYTGVANANGNDAATLTVSTIDGQGGSLASNPVINLDITAQNDAPTVTGTPADIAVSEDQAGNVDLSALTFADVDAGDTLTVTLTAGSGILAANSAGGVVVGDSGTSAISLAGTAAAITVFLQTASNIQYTSALNANGDDADTITVSALDGGGAVLASNPVINVDIAAVNDIPTVTGAPADLTVLEDTASNLDLSGMSFADVDGDPLTVTMSVNAGMLAATSGGGVTVGGTGTGTLTLAGTAAAINTFLDTASNVQYTGALNVNGDDAATLTVSASDGQGGTLATNQVINLDITGQNDAPTVIGAPTDVAVTEDESSNVDLTGMVFADVEGDNLLVTMVANGGTLAAVGGGGVIVAGSGTNTLQLSGALDAINAYLDFASLIQYTSAQHVNGDNAATLTVAATDSNGATLAAPQIINLDIAKQNDAPTGLPEITGVSRSGETVAADLSGIADADTFNLALVSFQWLRNGVNITGETASTYDVSTDDVGALLSVRISYTDNDGTVETLTSPSSAFVKFGDQVILGTDGDDALSGSAGNDLISGGLGEDFLLGSGGSDTLNGNDGDDILLGGGGSDSLFGNLGDDTLFGGRGSDTLDGGAGRNDLHGMSGNDLLIGNNEAEKMLGGTGRDTASGGGGEDTLIGGTGDDLIDGGAEDDIIEGGSGADTMDGGDGSRDLLSYANSLSGVTLSLETGAASGGDADGDVFSNFEYVLGSIFHDDLTGNDGSNELRGLTGNDTLRGELGDDTLLGGSGRDSLQGSLGNDLLDGGDSADTLFGGAHDDTLIGAGGDDQLFGVTGRDILRGWTGNDTLNGGGGYDQLFGGADNDLLDGGAGNDELTGGLGEDLFVFEDGFGDDTVFGFSSSDQEDIDLTAVTEISSFDDLIANHLSNNGGNAQINDGAHSILLQGVAFDQVGLGLAYSAEDFVF